MPYIPVGNIEIENNSGFGECIYGDSLYNDYEVRSQVDYKKIDDINKIKGLNVVFRDQSGYVLHKFYSESGFFPFSVIQFSHSLKKGCSQAELIMIEDIEKYGINIEPGACCVEIYLFRSEKPFWVGEITEVPSEISSDKEYKYSAEGYSNRLENVVIDYTIGVTAEPLMTILLYLINQIRLYIPQIKYNPSLVKPPALMISNMEFKKESAITVLEKLSDICQDYIFGVNENYEFYFIKKNATINPLCIFLMGRNAANINLKKTNYDKLRNRYYVHKKTTSGNIQYVTNGEINQINSQKIYGIRAESLTIPDNLSDSDALSYAALLLNYRAFPNNSVSVSGIDIMQFSGDLLKPDGRFLRIFSREKYHLELITEFKSVLFWSVETSNLTINTEPNESHVQGGSIRINGTSSSLGQSAVFSFSNPQNMTNKIALYFWIKSNIAGQFINFCLGDDINGFTEYPIYITNAGLWERKKIDLQAHSYLSEITKVKIKAVAVTQGFQIYVDQLESYFFGSKKYESEISEVNYVFQNGQYGIELEAGTPEVPFVGEFITLARRIKTIEACNKT